LREAKLNVRQLYSGMNRLCNRAAFLEERPLQVNSGGIGLPEKALASDLFLEAGPQG